MIPFAKKLISSFKFRIFLFVLAAIMPAFLLSFLQLHYERNRELSEMRYTTHQIVELIAQQESDVFDGTRQLLEAVAAMPEIRNAAYKEIAIYLRKLASAFHRYRNFFLLDAKGTILANAFPADDAKTDDKIPALAEIAASKSPVMSGFHIDPDDHSPSVYFGYPLIDRSGYVSGALAAVIDLSYLNVFEQAIRSKLQPEAVLTKIDREGIVLIREPDPEAYIGKKYQEQAVLMQIGTQQDGVLLQTDTQGQKSVFAFSRMPSKIYASDIYVIVSIPEHSAFAGINQRFYRELLILGIGMILISLLTMLSLDPFLMHDVQELIAAAKKMQKGDLTARARHFKYSSIELQQLVRAFNTMADSMQKSQQQLLDSYEATLEGWVRILDIRDNETSGHSKRVTDLALQFAREAHVKEDEMPNIRRGALSRSAVQIRQRP
ncbi:exported hypothetical protein [uncultured spirochete]|jgi:hypothetical protein|uniref:HAMP domain-containing protein n=2 Tax=Spirochaetales TaxID=136 RepID=A0A3P3XLY8_9SPIR|nr:exported hypothetical protein [uncultured spirochete]